MRWLAFLLAFAFLTLIACDKADTKLLDSLGKFTKADLVQAATLAGQADPQKDPKAPYRQRCYLTLAKHVPDGSTVKDIPELKGLVSGIELGLELKAKVRADALGGIPADIEADCAFLAQELTLP